MYNVLCIIMRSVNFFCNISSYDILAYHKERGLIVFGCKHRSPHATPISEFMALLGSLLSEVIEFERWAEIKKIIYAHVSFVNLTPISTPFKTKKWISIFIEIREHWNFADFVGSQFENGGHALTIFFWSEYSTNPT